MSKKRYARKLRTDKAFLIQMLDDPTRAMCEYRYKADDKTLVQLEKVQNDILKRASVAFNEIVKVADNMCEGCNAC